RLPPFRAGIVEPKQLQGRGERATKANSCHCLALGLRDGDSEPNDRARKLRVAASFYWRTVVMASRLPAQPKTGRAFPEGELGADPASVQAGNVPHFAPAAHCGVNVQLRMLWLASRPPVPPVKPTNAELRPTMPGIFTR